MGRVKFIRFLISCLFLILGLGLFNLQVAQGRKYRQLSSNNCIRLIPKFGARGKILDSQGNIIVDSKIVYDVMFLPRNNKEIDKVLSDTAAIINYNTADLKKNFRENYFSVSVPVVIAKDIDVKNAIALVELGPKLPGIVVQSRPARNYPFGRLAAHVIGYLGEIDRWRLTRLEDYGYKTKDIVGFGGVEESFDYYLRQEEGGMSFEVDHRGRFVRVLGFQSPRNGKDVQLTLNLKIQKIAENALGEKKGCVVIMDPYSGEIIAMVSVPNFNPSVFINRNNSVISSLFSDRDAPLINRAITSTYPPGSVFKAIVAAAGLEMKKINLSTSFLCQGKLAVGRREFKCWSTHGQQDVVGALAHSCDVFFYKTGLLMGAQSIHDYALRFGLSRPTGFDLSYESGGFIPSPLWMKINKFKNWYDGDTANVSIGQGDILTTPLQMVRMISVFANKGNLVTPYVVKDIANGEVRLGQKKIYDLHLKPEIIETVRQGLRDVVKNSAGTGNVLSGVSISVAGKTGTAQAPPGQSHAWFTGFFPYQEPKFAICVLLDHGGPGYYACVVAKQIIDEMIKEGLV